MIGDKMEEYMKSIVLGVVFLVIAGIFIWIDKGINIWSGLLIILSLFDIIYGLYTRNKMK